MDRKKELLVRVYLVFFGFIFFAMLIIGQVIKISLIEGDKWRNSAQKNVKWFSEEGERGNIYSCRGNLLATSIPQFDIYVDLATSSDKNFYDNVGLLSRDLSKHFGKDSHHWQSTFVNGRKSKKRYHKLFTNVTKAELDLLNSFPLFNLGRNRGGFISERKSRREKPFKSLCARTVGIDRVESKVGLEKAFDKFLGGDTVRVLKQRFTDELWLPVYQPTKVGRGKGADIVTTLDMRMQGVAHSELRSALQESSARAGTAVIMEVSTGAIKAMVNLSRGSDGSYYENWNHAVGTLTEPGSTFKLVSALAMLEDGVVDLNTRIDINGGRKKFYTEEMFDSDLHGIKYATFKEVFAKSSNVGMGTVAFDNYKSDWSKFYESIAELGVSQRTGVEIYGEPEPFFKNPKDKKADRANKWSGTTIPWMAHGYELKMTPLQILNVYNAVANDGRMMRPHLVTKVVKDGKAIKKFKPKTLNEQIASPSTILKAKKMLKAVAESGTAKKLKTKEISFAGKTGTTKVNYWTENKEYNASFAGYFPVDNPKYSMVVVLYDPKGEYYGAQVAGPVFRDILKRLSGIESLFQVEVETEEKVLMAQAGNGIDFKKLLSHIGVDYQSKSNARWVNMEGRNDELEIDKKTISKTKMSDLTGMGLRDAMYVLESIGMEVETEGLGQVYRQSVRPGALIKDKKIKIYLR